MITVKDLAVGFGGKTLFEEVNFIINRNDKIGLIGRNGSGKSTLMKLLLKKMSPTEGVVEIAQGYTMGHLEQHINFKHATVIEELCSVLPLDREHEGWQGYIILEGLGFNTEQIESDPNKLSGGNQVKLSLAKMLLLEPHILLLDEPTNYLDIYSIRWLTDFLKKWRGALILITHDRSFMDNIINGTLFIHRAKIRKMLGDTQKMAEQIATEEEIYEQQRIIEGKQRAKTEAWITRFRSKAVMAARVQSRVKMLDKKEVKDKLNDIDDLEFKFSHLEFSSREYMLSLHNISFGYTPDKLLIKNFSMDIKKDDKICIIGKNGHGKSTLLKIISGELKPLSGTVEYHSKTVTGYFGQTNVEQLNPHFTIYEEMQSLDPSLTEQQIRRTCSHMMFKGDTAVTKKISVLSGGEKSRVMLGKIVLTPVNLLLLDEPTNHFDMESSEALMESIKYFEGAVIMVSHNEHFLHEIGNKFVVFDKGRVFIFEGTYADFLNKIGWQE